MTSCRLPKNGSGSARQQRINAQGAPGCLRCHAWWHRRLVFEPLVLPTVHRPVIASSVQVDVKPNYFLLAAMHELQEPHAAALCSQRISQHIASGGLSAVKASMTARSDQGLRCGRHQVTPALLNTRTQGNVAHRSRAGCLPGLRARKSQSSCRTCPIRPASPGKSSQGICSLLLLSAVQMSKSRSFRCLQLCLNALSCSV